MDADFNVTGVQPVDECADRPALDKAIYAHERACLPAPEDVLRKEALALRLSVTSARMKQDEMELQARIYAQRLSEWPGDAALAALREWPSRSKWWPAWHELEQLIRSHCGERVMRRDALRRLRDGDIQRDNRAVGNRQYANAHDAERARGADGVTPEQRERQAEGLGDLARKLRSGLEADDAQA